MEVLGSDFNSRSRVEVQKLTFDDVVYIPSPDFISIYNRFELEKIVPEFVQIGQSTKILVYLKQDPVNS